jgi:hypothetical protein
MTEAVCPLCLQLAQFARAYIEALFHAMEGEIDHFYHGSFREYFGLYSRTTVTEKEPKLIIGDQTIS